jgi:hypothetical protein
MQIKSLWPRARGGAQVWWNNNGLRLASSLAYDSEP